MWKANWNDTRRRFVDWWNHEGLLVGMWGALDVGRSVHAEVQAPLTPAKLDECYTNPFYRAAQNHYRLSRSVFPLDILPTADTDLGPGSLALFLGSKPGFARDTVWFHPCIETEPEPERLPPLKFNDNNPWWRVTESILLQCKTQAKGNYLVTCPDLLENMDLLASLRGAEILCMDMIERPEWVEERIREINNVWFAVYERIYNIIKMDDGSSAFGAFYLWGPGRVAKVQCDSSAMFSPSMYRQFVIPSLRAQCDWIDHCLYHLDGTQALQHLDALLEIESLDAIEWTPQAGIESGGNPRWYDLYRRILSAGKSVQVVNVELHEIAPLLDAIGNNGVYTLIQFKNEQEVEEANRLIAPYYS